MPLPSYDELVSEKLPSYEDLTALPSYDELTAQPVDQQQPEWVPQTAADLMSSRFDALPAEKKREAMKRIRIPTMADTGVIPAKVIEPILKYTTPLGFANQAAEMVAPNSTAAKATEGVITGASEALSGFTTPEGLSQLAIMPQSKIGQIVLNLGFGGKALSEVPEQVKAWGATDDPTEKAKIATNIAVSLGLPAVGLTHGLSRAGKVPKPQADLGIKEPPSEFVEINRQNALDLLSTNLGSGVESRHAGMTPDKHDGSNEPSGSSAPPAPPSPQLSPIKEAAIRLPDGTIVTSKFKTHMAALGEAQARGFATGDFESGFVTNDGEFLNSKEALARAREIRQIEGDQGTTEQANGGLEAKLFEKQKRFIRGPSVQAGTENQGQAPGKPNPVPPIVEPSTKEKIQGEVSAAPNPEPQGASDATGQNAVIDKSVREQFRDSSGAVDLPAATQHIGQVVNDALSRGEAVKLIADFGRKTVPIVRVRDGQLIDAKGQPWGTFDVLSGGSKIEIARKAPSVPEPNEAGAPLIPPKEKQFLGEKEPETELVRPTGQNEPTQTPQTGIARRYIQDDIDRGILPPEALVTGMGWTPEEAITKGRELINKGVDPKVVVDAIKGNRRFPAGVKDAGEAVAVLHAEGERLAAERSAAQQAAIEHPQNPELARAARTAEASELHFLKESKPQAGGLAQRIMVAFQEARPVDLSTFDGLYRKAIEHSEGRALLPAQKAELVRRANKAKFAKKAESSAIDRLQKEMDRKLPQRKVPTDAELAAEVQRMHEELTPCL